MLVDPRVEYVGASKLRTLNTRNLGELKASTPVKMKGAARAVMRGVL
jgi:hypothetical protein